MLTLAYRLMDIWSNQIGLVRIARGNWGVAAKEFPGTLGSMDILSNSMKSPLCSLFRPPYALYPRRNSQKRVKEGGLWRIRLAFHETNSLLFRRIPFDQENSIRLPSLHPVLALLWGAPQFPAPSRRFSTYSSLYGRSLEFWGYPYIYQL